MSTILCLIVHITMKLEEIISNHITCTIHIPAMYNFQELMNTRNERNIFRFLIFTRKYFDKVGLKYLT